MTSSSGKDTLSTSCCSPAADRTPGAGLYLLLGLAGGLLGGIALARGRKPALEPARLIVWEKELAKSHGTVPAGFLSARIRARLADLYASRPRFAQPALRHHLEENILPGLALYQVLCEEIPDRDEVFAEFDRLMEASINASTLAKQARLLRLFPNPYPIFHMVHNLTLNRQYPPEGWTFHWLEDSDRAVAYDCTNCFYLNILTNYGARELTAHFCHGDDLLFSRVPGIAWKRTMTLGRGDPVCNFRFEKQAVPA